MEFLLAFATLILGTGWLFTYRAYKRKANGEATQVEAEGWKAQQDVYQQTIEDLKESCEYIKQDRNLLREENTALRAETEEWRSKYRELEGQFVELPNLQRWGVSWRAFSLLRAAWQDVPREHVWRYKTKQILKKYFNV